MDQTVDLLDYMQNRVLNTLKSSLTSVSDSNLKFKPEGELNTLKYLFYHVVNCPFIYLSGLGKKEFNSMDFNLLAIDIEKIQSFKEIIEYYNSFYIFLDNLKTKIKPSYLDDEIVYNLEKVGWGSWSLTGQKAIETAFEEIIHHRGQIYVYLRILGIKPPLIYPYL